MMKITFAKAAALTAVVFLAGLGVGFGMDVLRVGTVSHDLEETTLDVQEFSLLQTYLENIDRKDCRAREQVLHTVAREAEQAGNRLEDFGRAGIFREKEFKQLVKRYYLAEIRYWMLLQDLREECNRNLTAIVYFFKPDHADSTRQGNVLTALRQQYQGKVFVFSFNRDFDKTTIVDVIERQYNITQVPSLIINGEVREGFTSKGELEGIIQSD